MIENVEYQPTNDSLIRLFVVLLQFARQLLKGSLFHRIFQRRQFHVLLEGKLSVSFTTLDAYSTNAELGCENTENRLCCAAETVTLTEMNILVTGELYNFNTKKASKV